MMMDSPTGGAVFKRLTLNLRVPINKPKKALEYNFIPGPSGLSQ